MAVCVGKKGETRGSGEGGGEREQKGGNEQPKRTSKWRGHRCGVVVPQRKEWKERGGTGDPGPHTTLHASATRLHCLIVNGSAVLILRRTGSPASIVRSTDRADGTPRLIEQINYGTEAMYTHMSVLIVRTVPDSYSIRREKNFHFLRSIEILLNIISIIDLMSER